MNVTVRGLFAAGLALFSLIAMRPIRCEAQDYFKPDELAKFDGKSWGGLTIGESTTDDIKHAFKTSKGAVRPEAMVLPQPAGSPVRIDVLMRGRGGKSILTGFRLAYNDGAMSRDQVKDLLPGEPEIWYARQRFSKWFVELFPDRGISVFVRETEEGKEEVPLILLCPPDQIRSVVTGFDRNPTKLQRVEDVYPEGKKLIELGQVRVDISSCKGIDLDNKSDIENSLERQLRRLRTPSEVDIVSGGAGSLKVSIEISYKNKKGDVTADATVEGNTQLGRVYTTGHGSEDIRDEGDKPAWKGSRRLERAMFDAVDRAISAAVDKIRKQRPPTIAELRELASNDAVNRATK